MLYAYIYIYRERERKRVIYIYIYIYTHIHIRGAPKSGGATDQRPPMARVTSVPWLLRSIFIISNRKILN